MTARTRRPSRYPTSGSRRSTPRCSSRGNARPASTTMISPPVSKTVMFFPTSPRPPSGMIRSSLISAECMRVRRRALGQSLRGGRLEQAQALETASDRLALAVGRLDEREAKPTDLVPEEVQRALDGDRVDDHAQQLDRRDEFLVDRARPV